MLLDQLPQLYFKMTELELTTERSYQTHYHNIHLKMTGLVRRFSRRRNKSSSRIHCCYIITGTEFKEKHILEQDELFCCAIISSGLKGKHICPFLLLENPNPSLSCSGTPDVLSTYLGTDSLNRKGQRKKSRVNTQIHVHDVQVKIW